MRGVDWGGQPTAPPQPAPSRTFSQAHCGVLSGGIPAIKCFATTPPPSAASATTRRAKAHMPPPPRTPGGVPGARDNHVRLWDIETATPPPSVLPPPLSSSPLTWRRGVVKGGGASPWQGFPADRHATPRHAPGRGGELFSFRHPCMQVGGFGSGSSRPGVEGVEGDPSALAQPPARSLKGFVYGFRGAGCRWAAASRPTAPPGTSSKTPSGSVRLNP